MNRIFISGRLTRNSEVKFMPSGKAVMQFSLANNTGYGDKQQTHYFDCSLFGDRASGKLQEYMTKGAQVLVEGEISLNTYQKNDGTTGASLRVLVNDVEIVFNKSNDQSNQNSNYQKQLKPNNGSNFNDDIPFMNDLKILAKHHLI